MYGLSEAFIVFCTHRWTFCDFFQNEDMEKYSFPQLIQVVWYQGVFYRYIGDHLCYLEDDICMGIKI